MKTFKNLLLVFLLVVLGTARAQQAVIACGEYFSNLNGSLSFSMGETATETFINSSAILTQGFQQSGLKVLAIDEPLPASQLVITAFPNPVREVIKIRVENATSEQFVYHLFDSGGKLLSEGQFETPGTDISCLQLQPAIYFLKIYSDQKEIKGFKIIKQ